MESVQSSREPSEAQLVGKPHHQFALQQYGKALHLMKELPQRRNNSWFRNTLLSCLLTTCFENFIGNQDTALAQAQAGIDVLIEKEMTSEQGKEKDLSTLLRTHSFDDMDLHSTFARLEASVIMFKDNRQVQRRLLPLRKEDSAAFKETPDTFESVRHARFCWDLGVRRALQWRTAYLQSSNFSTFDFGENNVTYNMQRADELARRIQMELGLYIKQQKQWLKAFQPLFDKSRENPGSKEFFGASILMMQYHCSKLSTSFSGQNYETYCDAFLQEHIAVVNLAHELLETYPCTNSPGKTVFVFDDGQIVAGLFLVATRCRDKGVRRHAIRLLQRHPRREGLWDSAMAVKASTWLMNVEEEGLVDGFVPESARLRIVKTDLKLSERRATIRCSKLMDGCEERVEMSDVTLTW